MKEMIRECKKRLACQTLIEDGVLTLTPYNVKYNVMFEIGKHYGWYSLWEFDGKWYLLGESKDCKKVVDRIIREHGGLAL